VPTIETRNDRVRAQDGDGAMDNQQASHQVSDRGRRGCLVEGCPCKDARIVSQRRTAFFAAWARDHGETADRSVAPDVEWRIASVEQTAA
jgi:hypothetical protein